MSGSNKTLKDFKSNVLTIFRILKEKPENHVGRQFLSEALNAVIEQEFDAEFEIIVPSSLVRREYIHLLDLSKRLACLGIDVSLSTVEGLSEDEKIILCTMVSD